MATERDDTEISQCPGCNTPGEDFGGVFRQCLNNECRVVTFKHKLAGNGQ